MGAARASVFDNGDYLWDAERGTGEMGDCRCSPHQDTGFEKSAVSPSSQVNERYRLVSSFDL